MSKMQHFDEKPQYHRLSVMHPSQARIERLIKKKDEKKKNKYLTKKKPEV